MHVDQAVPDSKNRLQVLRGPRIALDLAANVLDVCVDGALVGLDGDTVAASLAERVYRRLNLRPTVRLVEARSLPRYELKAARFRRSPPPA